MQTEDLIRVLSSDAPAGRSLRSRIFLAMAAGAGIGAVVLVATIGLRPDLAQMVATPRVLFKILFTLSLAAASGAVALGAGVPGIALRGRAGFLALPVVALLAALVSELSVLPEGEWARSLVGKHAAFCMVFIPFLSLFPLAALLVALREGAPESPALGGAAAGLCAGSIAAALYAWHCPDDSPLFVATWYLLAIALVTAAGGAAGRRWLRW